MGLLMVLAMDAVPVPDMVCLFRLGLSGCGAHRLRAACPAYSGDPTALSNTMGILSQSNVQAVAGRTIGTTLDGRVCAMTCAAHASNAFARSASKLYRW